MGFLNDPRGLLLAVPPILFALCIHEFSHAYVAYRFGDPTAAALGRLTLNPLRHLDPLGTLLIFFVGFGWARPVPVDPRNLANPRRDMLWIAAAGPVSNLLVALVSGLLLAALVYWGGARGGSLVAMLRISVLINLALAFFNAIPLAPLDGASVLRGLVSHRQAVSLSRYERYGPMVLLGLVASGYLLGTSFIWLIIGLPVNLCSRIFTLGLL